MKIHALIKPNTKREQYGKLTEMSAIEMPLWLLLLSNSYPDSVLIDAEALNLDRNEILDFCLVKKVTDAIILNTGSQPSAIYQQNDESSRVRMLLQLNGIPTVVYDHLPFSPLEAGSPNYSRLPVKNYRAHNWHSWGYQKRSPYGSIFTSVSCPFNCLFCCIHAFYDQPYQTRDIMDVVADAVALHDLGIVHVKIMDELFAIKGARLKALSRELTTLNLGLNMWGYARIDTVNEETLRACKAMGVNWLAYGIESADEFTRQKSGKGKFTNDDIRLVVKMTKHLGINVVGNFMFGFEDDDLEAMRKTFDFAQELNCEYSNFYCLTPYPTAKISAGAPLQASEAYSQYSKDFKPMATRFCSGEEVRAFRDRAFKEYYTDSRYLLSIQEKFGEEVVREIEEITTVDIERGK